MSDCSIHIKTESMEESIPTDETASSQIYVKSAKKPRKSRFKNCAICGIIKNNVSFHRFPSVPDTREQWALFCGLDVDKLGSSPVICGNHFTEDDFMEHQFSHGDRKLLKRNSIPSRNPPKHNHEVYSTEELIYETVIVNSFSDNTAHSGDEITTDFGDYNVASDDDSFNANSDATVAEGNSQKRQPLACKRKFPRYFMDIKNEDVSSPKYAELCLEMGREAIFNYRKKINALQHQNKRLQNKLLTAETIIHQLRTNSISMEEALNTIETQQIFRFANKGCFI